MSDPPDHTPLRRLVRAAFTRWRVEALRSRVTRTAERLADSIAVHSETDLVRSYTGVLREPQPVPGRAGRRKAPG